MSRSSRARGAAGAALLAAALSACARDGALPPDGGPYVVVDEVPPGSAAARAGLQPGDALFSWERAASPPANPSPASGRLRTPFDVYLLEIREDPRGRVTVHGRRGAQALAATLPPGIWDLHTRPHAEPAAPAPGTLESAWRSYRDARAAARARDWPRADAAYAAAVEGAGQTGDLAVLAFLERERGFAFGRQARLEESRRWHERALRHREAQSPEGLEAAASHVDLGIVSVLLNELEPAEARLRRALAILEREAPRWLGGGMVIGYLGLLQEKRGNLAGHEEMQARALALQEALDPVSPYTAATLHNLGDVVRRRGDYRRAELYYRRALAVRERLPPDRRLAYTLLSLGHVQRARGHLAGARAEYARGLGVVERHGPDATAEAALLTGLGDVALESGDAAAAEERFRAALAAFRQVTPAGAGVIAALLRLGGVAQGRGQYREAEALLAEALAVSEKAAPGGLDVARATFHLGDLALAEGRWADAERRLRRALALQEQAAPGTAEHAEALHRLGLVRWRRGSRAEAEPLLARAVAALDAQQGRLGGTEESAARFRARYLRIYRDAMELGLERGKPEGAFETLERSRAAALREMLAGRDVSRPRERQARRAALGEAPVLGAAEAAASLEPGVVALSYAVGPAATHVFVVRAGRAVRAVRLGAGERELRAAVERFRLLLAAPGPGPEAREGVLARGEQLYRLLLEPVADEIEPATALLVVPDGPLHLLPFAALVRASPARHFVAEWKPLSTTASLSVRALLLRAGAGRVAGGPELVAFGDPRQGALPGSRREVQVLAGHFGTRGRAFLGPSATEARVKEAAPGARRVHFAVHGVLDDARPLDSGLLLAPAGVGGGPSADGLLQAWEIVEALRLDADLVALSACETALGSDVPGEGIMGLASAFQYAGAQAVLASLWKVSDASTAALMERLYRHLAAGRPAVQALQAAQVELIRGPAGGEDDRTHPFHWAAFQINGAAR